MTYENILDDMLSRVTSDIDKREGSIIFDAIAPCAYKLAENYFLLNNFIDLVSGDTAVGEYLDRVVADYGITRKQATKAIRKVETSSPIDIGTRWGLNDTTYTIIGLVSSNIYTAECEQLGAIGNAYSGTLENIDNISGVTVNLTDIILSGADTEEDENLRKRFYIQIQTPSTSGNVYNYTKWALEVEGVGNVKVFPLWNGNGTVKLLIVDNEMSIDTSLETKVFSYIETVRPIGATVTVTSPIGKAISVNASITLNGSKTLLEVKALFNQALLAYFKEITFNSNSVSYARIGSMLLSTEGVADYSNLFVNSGSANVTIADTEMPIINVVTLLEV